jgi:hypothetical protein
MNAAAAISVGKLLSLSLLLRGDIGADRKPGPAGIA